MRVGMGYDVHKLTEGRKLILGGVDIPWEKGLLGHSDADVLIHAVMDALLGAAALGQHLAAVVLIHVVNAVFSQRKAQHIGGHRLVAVLIVQLCNGSVIHKSHADLSRLIEVLIFQHSVAGTADQDPQARRHFYGFL